METTLKTLSEVITHAGETVGWEWKKMRSVGKRQIRNITENASGELLKEGAIFNDELHKLPTGSTTHIRKGVYRFHSHEEANRHQDACVVEGMVEYAKR